MATRKLKIKIEGEVFEAEVEEIGQPGAGRPSTPATQPPVSARATVPHSAPGGTGKQITAPMPGKIISIRVIKGQQITVGDTVVILEAMKMEQEIKAAAAGTVLEIPVKEGETVTKNQSLILLG